MVNIESGRNSMNLQQAIAFITLIGFSLAEGVAIERLKNQVNAQAVANSPVVWRLARARYISVASGLREDGHSGRSEAYDAGLQVTVPVSPSGDIARDIANAPVEVINELPGGPGQIRLAYAFTEHFYTASVTERDKLVSQGWNNEGKAW